jgi:hypothetical protein
MTEKSYYLLLRFNNKLRLIYLTMLISFGLLISACDDPPPALTISFTEPRISVLAQSQELVATLSEAPSSVEWRFLEKPIGSSDTIDMKQLDPREPLLSKAIFTPNQLGTYVIEVSAKRGERRAIEQVAVEVVCTPPTWQLNLSEDHPEQARVEGVIGISASLEASEQEGCPELDPLPFNIDWSLRSWPIAHDQQALETAFTPISPEHASLSPSAKGIYLVHARLTDALNRESEASLELNVSCGQYVPTVNANVLAGSEESTSDDSFVVTIGQAVSVLLTGEDADTNCLDEDEDESELQFRWAWLRRPAGSSANLSDYGRGEASFIPDLPGVYELQGEVQDSDGLSALTQLRFEAGLCLTRFPTIDELTAIPQVFELGQSSRLSLLWADPDLDCESTNRTAYQIEWVVLNAPAESIAQPIPANQASPSFTPDQAGNYTLVARVTDPEGHSTESTLELEVSSCSLSPMILNVESSVAEANLNQMVSISAVASLDLIQNNCNAEEQLETRFSYSWRVLSAPPGAREFHFEDRPQISWLAQKAGHYLFEVTATNQLTQQQQSRQVSVVVNSCGLNEPQINSLTHEGDLLVESTIRLISTISDLDEACGQSGDYTYTWSVQSRPTQSQAQFSEQSQQQARPYLLIDQSGAYQVRLTVSDSTGLEQSTVYSFEVNNCGEGEPLTELTVDSLSPLVGDWVSLVSTVSDPDTAVTCGRVESFTYHWTVEALPQGYLSEINLNGPRPSFYVERAGQYRFSLVVRDASGLSSEAQTIEISVQDCGSRALVITGINTSPAVARVRQSTRFEAQVSDPDAICGQDLSSTAQLHWTLIDRPTGSLTQIGLEQTPSLNPDLAGEYRVRVIAISSDGLVSAPQEQSINVDACGAAAPSAILINASANTVRIGEAITLTVQSEDADRIAPCTLNDEHHYQWRIISAPSGSQSRLQNSQASQSAFIPDRVGTYQFEVLAIDQQGLSAQAQIQMIATACGEDTPSLDRVNISNAFVFLGETIQLSAQARPADQSCVNDQSLQWQWRVLSRPLGSVAMLSSMNVEQPSFMPDQIGQYRFSVQVLSANGRSSTTLEVELEVVDCGALAPVINAVQKPVEPNDGFQIGENLNFVVNASNPNQTCGLSGELIVQWSVLNAPPGSRAQIHLQSTLSASFTPDLEGNYQLSVSVLNEANQMQSIVEQIRFNVGQCGGVAPEALIATIAPIQTNPADRFQVQTYTCQDSPFIQLDASQSRDENEALCGVGGDFTYAWSVQELSAGLSVHISEPNREAVNLSFEGLSLNETGTALLEVEVSNNLALTDQAQVSVQTTRLPKPNAIQVAPNFFCVGERTVTLTGVDFFKVGDQLPTVKFGDRELNATVAQNCVPVDQSNIQRCSTLEVLVPDGLESDLYSLQVRNPYPLACVDEGVTPTVLLISAPRIITAAPEPICRGQFAGEITLNGTGFLSEDGGNSASVTVNGEAVAATTLEQCIDAGNQLSTCQQARFDLPVSQRDIKDLNIIVTNPPTSGCAPDDLRAELLLSQSEPPIINEVTPRKICDQGGVLALLGEHFEPNMIVDLGPYRADSVQAISGEEEVNAIWTRTPQPRFVPGEYFITARNASGCEDRFDEPILVTEGPVPFFVDPPVVYNGITIQATAYLGNLFDGSVSKAEIKSGNAQAIELEFSDDPNKPSLIKLVIPVGLPVGLYDLTLYDDVNCPGTTPGLLRVTDDLSVNILELSPPFAWVNSSTSVTILADANAGFVPTPRSYLSPSVAHECTQDADCGVNLCRIGRCVNQCTETVDCAQGEACVTGACISQASELRAASLNSVEELKGVIASGFSPGEYDLVVVNPDGSVGLLERAVKVNPLPPPQIKAVSPGSWEVNNPALSVQVSGENFREVAIDLTCFQAGQTSSFSPNITAQTGSLISLNVDTSSLSANSICSVRLTNSDDAYSDFAPLTTTNPSGNFVDFTLGPSLPQNKARRLAAATFAKVPNGPPKLYVFGGDQGSDQQALDDNLSIGINALGNLEAWGQLPTQLPARLTRIEAHTIGQFIYIAGGYDADAGSATDAVYRAEILDPLYVPVVDQVDFEFDSNIQGLSTGIYYYRIAAIYSATDPNNPNGESLPSEPQPVFIPDIPVGVRLKLTWIGLSDANGYRIYRSPTPDLLFGQEELVAELPRDQLQWFDEGSMPLSNKRTLNIGELGQWSVVTQLLNRRDHHGTTVVQDPNDPIFYHLYAIGGFADGQLTNTYDIVSIDTTAPRAHQITSARRGANSLADSRSQLKVVSATTQEASGLPDGKTFVYALGGLQSDFVEIAEVNAGGLLSSFNRTEDMQRSRQGYYATIANNNLLSLCGQGGSVSSTAEKGEICGVNGGGRNCGRPEYISKWSSLGGTGLSACINPTGVAARGFLYLIGGGDANESISTKVDVSLLGGTP